jgi:tripartite-type tricarboxylate transporter receptor subunit TctC
MCAAATNLARLPTPVVRCAVFSNKLYQPRGQARDGAPGFESVNWNGFAARAGTARDISIKLHDEIPRRVVKSALREQLVKDGYVVAGLGAEEFAAVMKREAQKWSKVIPTPNVKIQ